MIEVKISVSGYDDGMGGEGFTRLTRQATDPARAVALALAAVAETVHSPRLAEIAEAAHRITRESS